MSLGPIDFVPRAERGVIRHESREYGRTLDGVPLMVWQPGGRIEIVVMASIHGDEAETTIVLSEALRCVPRRDLAAAVILCANPDGIARGTRGNAAGVDLNRNFPTSNWRPGPVTYKSRRSDPRDIELSAGESAGSEPETKALLSLLADLDPRAVVTLHSALECIDDADDSFLGRELARRSGLPLQTDIGYPTPGSMGTWAGERKLNLVTYELEAASPYELKDRHVPVMIDLMTGRVPLEGR